VLGGLVVVVTGGLVVVLIVGGGGLSQLIPFLINPEPQSHLPLINCRAPSQPHLSPRLTNPGGQTHSPFGLWMNPDGQYPSVTIIGGSVVLTVGGGVGL